MPRHPDPDVQSALTRLIDALCNWERTTGRESLLLFVPVEGDEQIVMADSGKPVPGRDLTTDTICDLVSNAVDAHYKPDIHRFMDNR